MPSIYTAEKIFTGTDWLPDHAIVIDREIIDDILPLVSLPDDSRIIEHYPIIAPAFIDLQIYGAYGNLFATYPSTNSLKQLYEYCVAGGAHFFTHCSNKY